MIPNPDRNLRRRDRIRFGLKLTAWIIGLGGLLALADSISTKRAEPAAVAIIALLVSVFLFV
jgi:hypothetical protein